MIVLFFSISEQILNTWLPILTQKRIKYPGTFDFPSLFTLKSQSPKVHHYKIQIIH